MLLNISLYMYEENAFLELKKKKNGDQWVKQIVLCLQKVLRSTNIGMASFADRVNFVVQ